MSIIHILIIDDNKIVREQCREFLEHDPEQNYEIALTSSYESGLEYLLSHNRVDCLLLDDEIGPTSYIDFITTLSKQKNTSKLPILLLLDDLKKYNPSDSIRQGIQDHLNKKELNAPLLQHSVIKSIELYQIKEALTNEHMLLDNVLESISQGVSVFDKKFNLIGWNQAFSNMMQYPKDFLNDARNIEDIIRFNANRGEYGDGDPEKITQSRLDEIYQSPDIKPHSYERMRNDGSYVEVCGNRLQGGGLVTTYTDVTARKKAEEVIQCLALNDPLTGLANRNAFHDALDASLLKSNVDESSVCLMLLDLDKFKAVNDTFGHPIGDELLKEVSNRLNRCINGEDIAARLGGDEFAVILNNVKDLEKVKVAAKRIIDSISEPYLIQGNRLIIGTSIGISRHPEDDVKVEELIRKADLALYEAKADGRGNYQFYKQAMDEEAKRSKIIEDELRFALQDNQFHLVYQPQFQKDNHALIGVEVFIRWQHPKKGEIKAADFISVAEQCGLISALGEWIIEQACRQFYVWQKKGMEKLRLALNVSIKQFQTDTLFDKIQQLIHETKLDPHLIELEINETVVVKNIDHVYEILNKLYHLGLSFAIGNFGTGLTFFNHLRDFPVSRIKLDSSFVHNMLLDEKDQAIVNSIIVLAQGLKLGCTAVGVENDDEFKVLSELGCDEFQGQLFCSALTADEFYAWYCKQRSN